MNLRQYLAALGASTLIWLFGQLGVVVLIPAFEMTTQLHLPPFWANFIIVTIYCCFQSGLAFLATLIATNLLPLTAQKRGCMIFATTGLVLAIWLRVAFFRHFERHLHQRGIVCDTLTDPFIFYFFVGALFCVIYVHLRKPTEPLITLR